MRFLFLIAIMWILPNQALSADSETDQIDKIGSATSRTAKEEFEKISPNIQKTLGIQKIDDRKSYYNDMKDDRQKLLRLSIGLRNDLDKTKLDITAHDKEIEDLKKRYRSILAEQAIEEETFDYSEISKRIDDMIKDSEKRAASVDAAITKITDDIIAARNKLSGNIAPDAKAKADQDIRLLTTRQTELRFVRLSELRRIEPLKQLPNIGKQISAKEKISKTLTLQKGELEKTTDELNDLLNRIDEKVQTLLSEDDRKSYYQTISTGFFALLVGIVIVGFFLIAWSSETVRNAIFAGDSGIQFVTLFSLVIAIILFGILGILEGKELAALLGGLSGYILGRGTNKTQPVQQS